MPTQPRAHPLRQTVSQRIVYGTAQGAYEPSEFEQQLGLGLDMVTHIGLAVSFAGALVLLLGVIPKSDKQLKEELESYASGFNRERTRAQVAERYDYRVGAALLALGFAFQILSPVASPTFDHMLYHWLITAVALTASLACWRLPRRALVDRDLNRLTTLIVRERK